MHVLIATLAGVAVKAAIETLKEEMPALIEHVRAILSGNPPSQES